MISSPCHCKSVVSWL